VLHSAVVLKVSSPSVSVQLALSTFFVVVFFLKNYRTIVKGDFPFLKSFIFIILSYCISTFFSLAPVSTYLTSLIRVIITEYLFFFVLWQMVETKKDIQFLVKCFVVLFFVVCTYGVYEKIFSSNPIIAYERSILGPYVRGKLYGGLTKLRLGHIRVQSFMPISITFGAYCSIFLAFIIYYYRNYKLICSQNYISIVILSTLLISGIFFSNSRSPFIFLFISSLCFINIRSLLKPKIFFTILILFLLVNSYFSQYFDVIQSIVDSDVDAGGSSLSMRTAQFNFAMSQFLDSPIIGKGYGSIISIFAVNCRKTIYGAESIWLWLMIERGLLGLFAYLSLFFDIFKIKTSKNRFFYIVFSLAYLGLLTVTTTPGLTIAFFLTLILIVYKSENISERSKKNVPQLVDRR
jgi:hypothetical protein